MLTDFHKVLVATLATPDRQTEEYHVLPIAPGGLGHRAPHLLALPTRMLHWLADVRYG